MFGFFKRNQEDDEFYPATRDILVTFNPDSQTADIVHVTDINHERVLGAELGGNHFSVPIQDVKAFTGPKGRVFFYNAPEESIQDVQRIAELEKSTVLRQITRYHDIEVQPPVDFMKYVLIGILGLTILILVIKLGGH